MYQLTGWKRKAVLLFKSEKRLGAKQIASEYGDKSYAQMKDTVLTEADLDWDRYEDKVRIKDLYGHLNKVKKEFIGQSELCFYHATLIILLRRGYQVEQTFKDFERLWVQEKDYLLANLNLRWIISACDTFVDHAPNPTRKAIFMNVASMVNTLKVYESQQFLYDDGNPKQINSKQLQKFKESDQPLYAGLTYFRIGNDDTLNNMYKRYKKFFDNDPLATQILLFVFAKLQHNDTAFALAKSLHSDSSIWWDDNK